MPDLVLRQGYFSDRHAFLALADLLQDTFGIDIRQLDRFGGPDPGTMPFGYFTEDGRCVANFSAFFMPLIIDGRPVRAFGYQSGAVRPECRGRGLYRDLMGRAFAWSLEQGAELGILLTDKPALYEPYGFSSVPQHAWRMTILPGNTPIAPRDLSVEKDGDIALIQRLLATRSALSHVFANTSHREFLLNACFDPDIRLSYFEQCDAVIAWKTGEAGELRLLDIVSAEMPPIDAISAALEAGAQDVVICFSPDRLDLDSVEPVPYEGSCVLMVANHAGIALPDGPFMLSPMAEF